MISHKVRQDLIKLGSLRVYFVWESPRVEIPITKNYYWFDKTCSKSMGPFKSVTQAMQNFAEVKKVEKALQKGNSVQNLHRTPRGLK